MSAQAAVPVTPESLDLYGRPTWRRRFSNQLGWGLCMVAVLLIVSPLIWLLYGVVRRALPVWHWRVLTTLGNAQGGGLANELVGTLLIVLGVGIIAGVVGVSSGIYLAEYAHGRLGSVLRAGSEVLAGIPSIVLGYVGFIALAVALHWQFSLAGALIALSALTVPYIAKATESALRQVPTSYREGSEALGMSPMYSMRRITIKAALPGITTGWLVALAIAIGETAPLLYTAGFSNSMPTLQLTHSPVPYLTYAVWSFYNYPSNTFVDLSYDAALILVVLVLLLILSARLIVSFTQRYTEKN
jgi:phosphate transport system permease protein